MGVYLICDDDEINNLILHKLIDKIDPNAIVISVNSGMDCIERYISLMQSNYSPKAIFLDQRMPRMTGTDVANVLRSDESNMPVGAYTGPMALVTAEHNPYSLDTRNHFTKILPKPLDKPSLKEFIESIQ